MSALILAIALFSLTPAYAGGGDKQKNPSTEPPAVHAVEGSPTDEFPLEEPQTREVPLEEPPTAQTEARAIPPALTEPLDIPAGEGDERPLAVPAEIPPPPRAPLAAPPPVPHKAPPSVEAARPAEADVVSETSAAVEAPDQPRPLHRATVWIGDRGRDVKVVVGKAWDAAIPGKREATGEDELVEESCDRPCREIREEKEKKRQQTLFGPRRRNTVLSPYVGVYGVTSGLVGRPVGMGGLEGGAILGRKLVLGGAVHTAHARFAGSDDQVLLSYAGFQPGWVFGPDKLLHLRTDLLLGSGLVTDPSRDTVYGLVGVGVPRIGVELNATKAIRVTAGAGWRLVSAPTREISRDLSGPELGIGVRVGWF